MRYDALRVGLEREVSADLYRLFSGDIIEELIREGRVETGPDALRTVLEGHSFKITERMAPALHRLCRGVQEALAFEEPVDFFVSSSAELNAMASPRLDEDRPHLVILNSEMLERFDDVELRFVIGHELGHLISKNADLQRIISFVFPPGTELPPIFRNKVELWNRLSELSADRYGFLASPDLERCAGVFFKLASGLDTRRIEFGAPAYLEEMDKVIEYFRKEPAAIHSAHPINPVRVKALRFFADSALCQAALGTGDLTADPELDAQVGELLELLLVNSNSELDLFRKQFVAAGGLIIAGQDEELSVDELDRILGPLASLTSFPKEFLQEVISSGDIPGIFEKAVRGILEINPSERYAMFGFLIDLALADQSIGRPEFDLLFQLGEHVFGFPRKEIAQQVGAAIQKGFIPRYSA